MPSDHREPRTLRRRAEREPADHPLSSLVVAIEQVDGHGSSRCRGIPGRHEEGLVGVAKRPLPEADVTGWDVDITCEPAKVIGLRVIAAGKPFCVTINIAGTPRDLGGLVDGEPVLAGQVVRVLTTGGGGWGDPLTREPELVLRDVTDGKVSLVAAATDYGVVLTPGAGAAALTIDQAATDSRRAKLRTGHDTKPPMIDRGEGFEKMLRGAFKPWTRST